ncbi:MAG: transglycosylase SLT domain-containing protein [Deltaproteobacteria bacterium]|nr:transglycosylase SLT domain-containing protein [Deltaproteobacteria bacterium]
MRPLRPLLCVAFATMACEVGSCGPPRRADAPFNAAGAPTAAASAPAAASSEQAAARFDLASVTPLLSHPALVDVRAALSARDLKAAADALDAVLKAGKLAGADVDRARFMLGRLAQSQQPKDDDRADAAYGAVSADSPLRPHASLRRATIAARKGKHANALALLEEVPAIAPFSIDRHFAAGDALAAKGDHAGAADAYSAERKGPRAFEAIIRWAEEVAAASKTGDALEAALAARKARFEHASSVLAPRAEEAENKCKALLPAAQQAAFGAATTTELASMAQAFLDAGKPKDALPIATKVLAAETKGSGAWCRAATIVARAHEKLRDRAKASDAYGDLAAGCTDEATHVSALYDGAKAALAAKLPDVARARFAAIEKEHPKHRLADDARVRGALAALDAGDLVKGEAMLSSLPDDYPEGDMRTEALFRLALPRMKKGDWAGAIPYLERSLTIAPREDGYFVAGRTQYFLGRAKIAAGAVTDGVARLREVIAREPLTFSAAMAYAQLAARGEADAAEAKKAIEQGIAFEPAGALFDVGRPEVKTASFARGVELARVGESDLARKELAAAGLLEDAAKDPGAQWLVAAIFAQVGDARSAHGFPRARLDEWTRHFPGGKWRAAWEIAFPRAWPELVSPIALKNDVPATLVWAVMREESAFDPEATSPSAAYGLLQLIVPTATRYAKPLKLPSDAHALLRPDVNVPLGVAYLKKLRGDFPDNPGLAVPSYNAGEGATRRWMSPPLADSFDLWVESIPYDETRKYTKRVLASYWSYIALYDPARLDAELRAAAGR